MSIITAIKKQEKRNRVNIYLDGLYALSLDYDEYLRSGLHENQEIEKIEIESLIFLDHRKKLLNDALRFLSYRPRSEGETRKYLHRRCFQRRDKKNNTGENYYSDRDKVEKISEEVIQSLKSFGQLNDNDFTRWWIEQRLRHKPKARSVIEMELSRNGVSKDIIKEVFESMVTTGQDLEMENALKLAEKKLMSLKNEDPDNKLIKINRFLAYRGFSWEIIKKVLSEIKGKIPDANGNLTTE